MAQFVPQRYQTAMTQFAGAAVAPQVQGNIVDRTLGFKATDTALDIAQGGVPFFPMGLGYVAALPISGIVAERNAKEKFSKLMETYRPEIAQQFNIPESAVSEQMVMLAAARNPGLRESVKAIELERANHLWVNGSSVAGMASGMGAASVLGLTALGPPGWIGGAVALLVGGAAAIGGGYVGGEFGKKVFGDANQYNPMTHVDKIKELRQNGEAIHPSVVFALRVSQNPSLNEAIKSQYDGKGYFDLEESQKLQVMHQCGGLMQCCAEDAMRCTQPEVNPDLLMFGRIPDNGPFEAMAKAGTYRPLGTTMPTPAQAFYPSASIANDNPATAANDNPLAAPAKRPATFAEMILAQRAKAAQAQQQV